ncbi:myb-related transcription factor%2C partner of profilin-like [Scomber scombrus]|uniref:Myb-related transcription factor, partner of profilin-like n=1 Tax=Scomber scombrus TaxID=13677 RepID=A0AAV1Q8W9_SCOSC
MFSHLYHNPQISPHQKTPLQSLKSSQFEDIDKELVQAQRRQFETHVDDLPSITQEVQAVSCLAWVIRRDTGAKAAHTRQLISAVSGLTVTIHSLVKGNEDCIPAVMRSLHPSGPLAGWERPTAEQPGTGEGHLCSCSNSLSLS